MKAIIGGNRYDTEKSILIGEADNLGGGAYSCTDFSYWSAGLYKTPRSGAYFLAGEGGAMTRWARHTNQDDRGFGSGIIPIDRAEALKWAERYLDTETVEKFFGEQVQDA